MKNIYKKTLKKDLEPVFFELTDYKLYLQGEKLLSENTVNSYMSDLEHYGKYLKKYRNINFLESVTKEDVIAYITNLKKNDIKARSIARKLTSIKSFHSFLSSELRGFVDITKYIDAPKKELSLPTVLSIDEVQLLIDNIKKDSKVYYRNKAIIELLFSSGLRISELTELEISQIHMNKKYLVIRGKGNKERIVPMRDIAINYLRTYLTKERIVMQNAPNNFVFINYKGNHLSRVSVFKLVKELAIEANINKEISPHTLRHSYATYLLNNGVDLKTLQQMLGHEDISTTQIYTHIEKNKLMENYKNAHPLAKKGE